VATNRVNPTFVKSIEDLDDARGHTLGRAPDGSTRSFTIIDSDAHITSAIIVSPVTEQSLTDDELRIYLEQVIREVSRARIGSIRP